MPFLDTLDGVSDTGDPITFYNVVRAVGQNCPNQYNDVKLIQIMLTMFYYGRGIQPPDGMMVPDGICGPVTKRWIREYQTYQSTVFGNNLKVDGRVDRAKNHQGYSIISNSFYTIVDLNFAIKVVDPSGWAAIPTIVPMIDAAAAPAPGNDYVSGGSGSQSTSTGGRAIGGMRSWAA